MKYIPLLFIFVFLVSCLCKKNIQKSEQTKKIEEMAIKQYGKDYKMEYNTAKDYALIISKKNTKKKDPFPTVFFSIINTKNMEVVYKDVIPGGKIKWIKDYSIEVSSMTIRPKDILNSTSNTLYKLNVKTLNKFK